MHHLQQFGTDAKAKGKKAMQKLHVKPRGSGNAGGTTGNGGQIQPQSRVGALPDRPRTAQPATTGRTAGTNPSGAARTSNERPVSSHGIQPPTVQRRHSTGATSPSERRLRNFLSRPTPHYGSNPLQRLAERTGMRRKRTPTDLVDGSW